MTPANEEDYDYETPESETEIIPSEDNSGRQSRELHTEETTTETVNHQQATARNVTAHKPTQRSTANIANLEDEVKRILHPLHEDWKEGIEIAHETKLADEIRQVYCELSNIRRLQTITLALSNGILAAAALNMPHCSRLHGMGQALLLQECEKKEANVTAIETSCGFQPFTTYNSINYTIGIDGWSLHPYSDCFWKSNFVNLNGKTFHWEHDTSFSDWVEQTPNIHVHNLELVAEFETIPLNDFDFSLKGHPVHEKSDLEQMNVLNELIGRIQESSSNSLEQLVQSDKQENEIGNLFSWTNSLKIMVLVVIGFILLVIVIVVFVEFKPFNIIRDKMNLQLFGRQKREAQPEITVQMSSISAEPAPTVPTQPARTYPVITPNVEIIQSRSQPVVHSHTSPSYIVGRGLVWEDMCPFSQD